MKTRFFKTLAITLFSSLFIASSCSNDDDISEPDDNNGNNNYTTVSQNVVNQEYFIEGLYFSGPERERNKTVPHSITVPVISKTSITNATDINAFDVVLVTVIGQRLSAPIVTNQNDITRVGREDEAYDSVVITFVITDDVVPNATLSTSEDIDLSTNPFNDMFTQTNSVINNGRFTLTTNDATNPLGTTLDNNGNASDPIESITFIANEEAFQDPSNNFIETNGTAVIKFIGNFEEFLNGMFDTTTNKNIAIIRTRTGINGQANKYDFYGL